MSKKLEGWDIIFQKDPEEPKIYIDNSLKKKKIISISLLLLVIISLFLVIIIKISQNSGNDQEKSLTPKDSYKTLYNDSEIKVHPNDHKTYEIIEFKTSKNKFILISDPYTYDSGIAIKTKFGYYTSIIDGFAHYAEHIFFGGSKKYLAFNLNDLISNFNGVSEAFTAHEETVFEFFSANEHIDIIMRYISSFITEPLLNETFIKTEINSINSEYEIYNNSYDVITDILIDNSNKKHPFSYSTTNHCGNNKTLDIDSKTLINYLKNYYNIIFKPENCIYIIYGNENIENLKYYAYQYFNFFLNQPDKDFMDKFDKLLKDSINEKVFDEGELGKLVFFNSLRETSIISFIFYVPRKKSDYINYKSIFYFLLNSNKKGSLIHYLRNFNFATHLDFLEISSFENYELNGFTIFLTFTGYNNYNKVIEAVFASINAFKNQNNEVLIKNYFDIYYSNLINTEFFGPSFPDNIEDILQNYNLFGLKNILGNKYIETGNTEKIKNYLNNYSPNNSFIIIDSPNFTISDPKQLKFTNNFKNPYKLEVLDEKIIKNLEEISKIEDYDFLIREINQDFSKLNTTSEIPCYKKKPPNCEYDEYNNINESYEPYLIKKNTKILSFMKIDRSYGKPLIKGYIKINLNNNEVKNYFNTNERNALFHLYILSFKYLFTFSTLNEGGSEIEFTSNSQDKIEITFTTYNDLLNKIIDFIIDFFNNPIEQNFFLTLKELYYFENSKNKDDPLSEFYKEVIETFKQFISVNSIYNEFSKEHIEEANYDEFKKVFKKINEIKTYLTYLTHGDISYENAVLTTEKLSKLIPDSNVILTSSSKFEVDIPYNSSILFSTKSNYIYQNQGQIAIFYEYNQTLKSYFFAYIYCVRNLFFYYLRTERGSGYSVKVNSLNIFGKNYIIFYAIGLIYSPEKMERLFNEAIQKSFTIKCPNLNNMFEYFQREEYEYFNDKFNDLITIINEKEYPDILYSKNFNSKITYENIIEKIRPILIDNPKRITILTHKGSITDEELKSQESELDKFYYLNKNIGNKLVNDIYYLKIYAKEKNITM